MPVKTIHTRAMVYGRKDNDSFWRRTTNFEIPLQNHSKANRHPKISEAIKNFQDDGLDVIMIKFKDC